MPIHLPDALLPQLAALARDADASRLVLFGSRARGDDRERSDIDLAVFGLDAAQAGRLRLALEELPTLLEFDLVCVDANTSPKLLDNIEREGVTLYASEMWKLLPRRCPALRGPGGVCRDPRLHCDPGRRDPAL